MSKGIEPVFLHERDLRHYLFCFLLELLSIDFCNVPISQQVSSHLVPLRNGIPPRRDAIKKAIADILIFGQICFLSKKGKEECKTKRTVNRATSLLIRGSDSANKSDL